MRIFLFKEYERIKRNLSTFDGIDYRIIEISLDPRRITSFKNETVAEFCWKKKIGSCTLQRNNPLFMAVAQFAVF